MKAKPLSPQLVEVADWLTRQVGNGCTRAVLRNRVANVERHIAEWALAARTDFTDLALKIRAAMECAAPRAETPMLFGLFAFRPERARHAAVAFLLRGSSR